MVCIYEMKYVSHKRQTGNETNIKRKKKTKVTVWKCPIHSVVLKARVDRVHVCRPFLVTWPTFFPPTLRPSWPCFSLCGQIHLAPSYLLSGHSTTLSEKLIFYCLPWLSLWRIPIVLHNRQAVAVALTQ